jgi:tRNA (guanine-N7-)-methyltransferase
VGKKKKARWAEMLSFENVIQPDINDIRTHKHPLKGKWNSKYFKNNNPIVLELGCGKGEYTLELAKLFPDKNFTGIDIKGARIWHGAKTAIENKIPNVLFLRTRIEFINSFFSENEVDEIWITFPDPFSKNRNSGKRLTSPFFLNSYRKFLKDKGIIHLKTDNKGLFDYTLDIVKSNNLEILNATDNLYSGVTDNKILSIRTYYENTYLNEGKNIHYLAFMLNSKKPVKDAG